MNERSGNRRKWACAAAALAGLTGASGIILAATAAHGVPDPRLQTAANFQLIHAAAALALCGLSLTTRRRGGWFLGGAGLFLFGSLLFGGDLAVRAFAGTRLFPMAAPLGGTLLLLGWLCVTFAAVAVFSSTGGGTSGQNIDE